MIRRMKWAWRYLPLVYRYALVFAHPLPRGHADRIALAHDIRLWIQAYRNSLEPLQEA